MATTFKMVTGYTGEQDRTPSDDASLNASILGKSEYVLDYGNKLSATIISANEIQLSDGIVLMQGKELRIVTGDTISATINNGETGYYRRDLIVAEYSKCSDELESCIVKTIEGTPSSTDRGAIVPSHITGDIESGATANQMPLYVVLLDGLSVSSITPQFAIAGNLQNQIGTLTDLATGSKTNIVDAVNENVRNVKINSANIVAKANKPKLLWENRSPTSSFAEQTVNLTNLHLFNWLLVVGRVTTESALNIQDQFTNVFSLSGTEFSLSKSRAVSAQAAQYRATNVYREMAVVSDSIKFKSGIRTIVSGGAITTANDNDVAVPIEIYGIK